MKIQDLQTGKPADQRRTKAASIIDDVQAMLTMAAGLCDEMGEERARDYLRGASTMAAHGNAALVERESEPR